MMKIFIKKHIFDRQQHAICIGGEGIIQSFKLEDGNWKYAVEMPQGMEPIFGRIGPETIVVLDEIELDAA